MSKTFQLTFAGAILAIAVLVWAGFRNTSGNHLEPAGKIGKLRVQAAAENLSIVVADFSITNDSDRVMQVRSIEAIVEMPDGTMVAATQVPSPDLPKIFQAFPLLGEQFNPPLHLRERIPPHQAVDRMVALRVEAPESIVERRKRFLLRIEDVTGPVLEMIK